MALTDFLERGLSRVKTTNPLTVHELVDTFGERDANDSGVSPQGSLREFLLHRRLILIFQNRPDAGALKRRPAIGSSQGTKAVLVMGMCVGEYAERCRPGSVIRAFIQYVDTTGLYEPRSEQSSVTKAMVSAYIGYLQLEAKASFLHLTALAQPNYLFPGSEHCSPKRVLETCDLVQWWLNILAISIEACSDAKDGTDNPETVDAIIHAYSPEKFGTSSKALAEDLFADVPNRRGLSLHYGLPFNDDDSIDDAIPLFEDDPKWRLYEQLYMRKSQRESLVYEYAEEEGADDKRDRRPQRTVQEFVEALSTRAEFFRDPEATIIIVEFKRNDIVRRQSSAALNSATKAKEMLLTLNFSDEVHGLASSAKLAPWVRFMGSKGILIDNNSAIDGSIATGSHSAAALAQDASSPKRKRALDMKENQLNGNQ